MQMEFAVNQPIVVVLSANSELGLGLVESLLKAKEWNVFSTYRKNSEQLNNMYGQYEDSPQERVFQADLSKWNEVSEMFESRSTENGQALFYFHGAALTNSEIEFHTFSQNEVLRLIRA